MRIIYVFGDSHIGMFAEKNRSNNSYKSERIHNIEFADRSCGSFTCYSLHTHDEQILNGLKTIGEGAEIWFLYGEIDARFRVMAECYKQNRTIDQVLDDIVKNYFDYIFKFSKQYKISVVSIIPPHRCGIWKRNDESIIMKDPEKYDDPGVWVSDPSQEVNGLFANTTAIERRYITEVLNSKFKLECEKRKIPFIDIYYLLVDHRDGFNKPDMLRSNDSTHYSYIGDLVLDNLDLDK